MSDPFIFFGRSADGYFFMDDDGFFFIDDEKRKQTKDGKLLFDLISRIAKAEEKHPDFADGVYQGVGVIGEEYGELCQALNKGEGEERVMDEALDLLCVAWRFCRGDWEKSRQE